jgi:DNA-binding NtrC family response regulator
MVEYIVTQNMKTEVSKFKAYFEVCKKKKDPISIVGPSGVGKSLFLHIFKQLYLGDNKTSKPPIIEVYCSHFVGADPNIARSELFGHVKGAFTGAKTKKDGLVKKADSGVLILEEVGNLPELVQAMLLTFIETKKFRKVGGEKEEDADVWIVAATNDESQLREDLKYRFFPFYIRPLYERREDILHYLAFKYPEIIRELRPFEILALLAYNWPGNVREIERIAKAFKIRKLKKSNETKGNDVQLMIEGERAQPFQLYWRKTDFSSFDVSKGGGLYFELEKYKVDVKFLESLLNKYRVGLSSYDKLPFSEFKKLKSHKDDELDITFVELNDLFADAFWEGLVLYCYLFQQSFLSNADLLDISKNQLTEHEYINLPGLKNREKKFLKLSDSIKSYIGHLKNIDDQDFDLTNMKFEELEKKYYSQLLEKEGGHQTKAAERAGLKKSTLRYRMLKYGLIKKTTIGQ